MLRVYGVLAGIVDAAVKDRRLPSNPAREVNLPRKIGLCWDVDPATIIIKVTYAASQGVRDDLGNCKSKLQPREVEAEAAQTRRTDGQASR